MSTIRPSLVLVDDEERIVRSLSILFRARYDLFATTDARLAIEHVRRNRVHVLISDQRMPVMRGSDLLREVRGVSPNTMRILLTGYSEMESIVDSVNEGEIFRFISKPWDTNELRETVAQAAEIALASFDAIPPHGAEPTPTSTADLPAILVIDDDATVATAVQQLVGPGRPVHWGPTLEGAFHLLAMQNIGVVISELFVGREPIALALKMLKAQHPEVVTIVMTPFQDTTALIGLINQGQVYRFLPKPIRRAPLEMSIAAALKHHHALRSAPQLRARHSVEKVRPHQTTEEGMASRVVGYLSRLRERVLAVSRT